MSNLCHHRRWNRSEGEAGFFGLLDQNDKEFAQTMDNLYEALGRWKSSLYFRWLLTLSTLATEQQISAVFRTTENGSKFNPNYSYSVERGYGSLLGKSCYHAQRNGQAIEAVKTFKLLLKTKKEQTPWSLS